MGFRRYKESKNKSPDDGGDGGGLILIANSASSDKGFAPRIKGRRLFAVCFLFDKAGTVTRRRYATRFKFGLIKLRQLGGRQLKS